MGISITDELRRELAHEFGPAQGLYRYRSRTRLERALFLATTDYARKELGVELDGLTSAHRGRLEEHVSPLEAHGGILRTAFNCHAMLIALSPTHPSSRGNEPAARSARRAILAQEFVAKAEGLCDALDLIGSARHGSASGSRGAA